MFCATEDNFITYSTRTVAVRVAERSNLRLMLLKLQYAISFRLARYINSAVSYWWHVLMIYLWKNWKKSWILKEKLLMETVNNKIW
jgi:hypothetical protein